MSYSLGQILLLIALYLSGLFTIAILADRGIISRRITHHPATYVLSLGVFAGVTASNAMIDLASRFGYHFLLYYGGATLTFILAALTLMPILRLCRVYQLASLADVLTFRFRSPKVGAAITIAMILAMLPLLALQIQAVADSVNILAGNSEGLPNKAERNDGIALLFCFIIIAFSIMFGTRHTSSQQRNTGLVAAIAFESAVKLCALLALMAVAIYQIFDGPKDLQEWLQHSPEAAEQLSNKMRLDTTRTLLLAFFVGAVAMPHIFHMIFAENTDTDDLRTATWGLPLYLLLLSLPILPIAWAGMKMGHGLPIEYTGLAMGQQLNSTMVSAAALVASLSAASAAIVVIVLALANMCLNHLVLPIQFFRPLEDTDIYSGLKGLRRGLIAILILTGYTFYYLLDGSQSLTTLALIAFSGTLQFLPGILAVCYWPSANRIGLQAGLWAGLTLWLLSWTLPSSTGLLIEFARLQNDLVSGGISVWTSATVISLGVNIGLFALLSLLSPTSEEERVAAEICSVNDLSHPARRALSLSRASEFTEHLTPALGLRTAQAEVDKALTELQFSTSESRPYALRHLRRRLEANLSGLLGPAIAHRIIENNIPFLSGGTEDINLVEHQLDSGDIELTGLAADLDNLRRRYRETLETLPVGVCSMDSDGEMLAWNRAMEEITGVPTSEVLGSYVSMLPQPWRRLLGNFQHSESASLPKAEITLASKKSRWVSLHKKVAKDDDIVILVEDISDFELMAKELLHNERLASIGRLAAGVAHEIGNPITGIACLAQNLEYADDHEEVQHTARDILKQTERVTRIVESLMNFSHAGSNKEELNLSPCNLADCIDEAIHLITLDRDARLVRFNNHCDRELLVIADSQRLLQVFVNLLSNARDACGEQGHVQVQAYCEGDQVLIDVDDNGSGIAESLQGQIFEPFFTTKDPGAGTGLGLALVYSIMEDMAGSIHLTSPLLDGPLPGSRFTLQLAKGSYGSTFDM